MSAAASAATIPSAAKYRVLIGFSQAVEANTEMMSVLWLHKNGSIYAQRDRERRPQDGFQIFLDVAAAGTNAAFDVA
jgi:hypothetical protein